MAANSIALKPSWRYLRWGTNRSREVFIRAPRIESVGGDVEVLAKLENGTPVAAREGNMIVTAFHPELTDDLRWHRYFLSLIQGSKDQKLQAAGTATHTGNSQLNPPTVVSDQ